MTARELEEYSALRATIRERGTARFWIVAAGFAIWTALTLAAAVLAAPPVLSLLTLLFLVALFEVVFSMHTGVERVGRYIQVFHEDEGSARWEHAAMSFGTAPAGSNRKARRAAPLDALFSPIFAVATLLNLVPVMVSAPVVVEWVVLGVVHLLFIVRIVAARGAAARQRALDLERFREMKNGSV